MPYAIPDFVADLKQILANGADESSLLAQVEPLAIAAAADRSWLRPEMYQAHAKLGVGTTLLHAEADHSLFIVVDCWLPGRGVPPHNHGTWAVVVGVTGTERNTFWNRTDDGSQAGHATLERIREDDIAEGQAVVMHSGEIHSVTNLSEETTLSFHVYGRHLNHTGRSQFDPDLDREEPFVIEMK